MSKQINIFKKALYFLGLYIYAPIFIIFYILYLLANLLLAFSFIGLGDWKMAKDIIRRLMLY